MDRLPVWVSPEGEKEIEKASHCFVWLSVNLGKHTDMTEKKNDWDIAKTPPWR